jgi:natural product biosynthesis luciferase-like monooxygenase protein
MHQKFNCFIVGEGTLLVQCAEILLQAGHDVHGIISANPAITTWAGQHDISVINPKDHLAEILSQQPFDYLFSIANLSIIPDELLKLPRKSAINFHDGPLPHYAGLNTPAWALLNREPTYGITWHVMGSEVDAGDILKQVMFDVTENETSFTINAKNYEVAQESFRELVDELASDTVTPIRQNADKKNFYGKTKRPSAAAAIRWNQDAENIAALVHALDFGVADRYTNPLALPKLVIGEHVFLLPEIEVLDSISVNAPGTITEIEPDFIKLASVSNEVSLRKLLTVDGQPITIAQFAEQTGAHVGTRIEELDTDTVERLSAVNKALARHEDFWLGELTKLEPAEPPYTNRGFEPAAVPQYATAEMSIPSGLQLGDESTADVLTAIFADYLSRINSASAFTLGFRDVALSSEIDGFENFFAAYVPLRVELAPGQDGLQTVLKQIANVRKRKSYARDMIARYPEMKALRDHSAPKYAITVEQVANFDNYTPAPGSELTLLIAEDGTRAQWVYQTPLLDAEAIVRIQRQFSNYLQNVAANAGRSAAEISLLSDDEYRQMILDWNATQTDYPHDACIHHLFERQVERTPDSVAVVFEDQEITYYELNRRANQLAHYLRKLGVGPDIVVGIGMERSLNLIVGLMGIHKAGGAYLPLDPTYPADRIAFMVEDAAVPVLLTQQKLVADLPQHNAHVVSIDSDWPMIARESKENPQGGAAPHNMSYLIYTSGSTGKPKGVMLEHRNVVNFFVGMDERLGTTPGVWLAVTSLSFDISVLELFWTLTRGFKVVLYAEDRLVPAVAANSPYADQKIDFSLFYFASDEGENVADKYELLLEGAKFGDRHGFEAIWTPERHFYAFGGLYPNPSVASAAIAAVTERIKIRAGSCVIPLHSPIRIAEEWALVDNISKGRVGISFAAGWQPNDFVLKPENFADRKNIMFRDIEIVRKLWRGEIVALPGPNGKDVNVRTLPRPIQPELPSWITIAGNPETFQMAGAKGFPILTHLLGQNIQELGEKLEIYRNAWREAGHPGNGYVSLMLHTFVGDDDDEVKEIVRQPMKNYLRDALDLTEKAAWSFPAFKQRAESTGKTLRQMFEGQTLSDEEKDAVLNHAFERYFETSGLFGTLETCLELVNKLKSININEIACLIDFGVQSQTVMKHLDHLNRLRELSSRKIRSTGNDYSIPTQVARHQVTHMQCTPSMASMLLINDDTRGAFKSLQKLMIGGEAFPVALADELSQLVPGEIINMYGPTETCIWSSTFPVESNQAMIPIGTPIANTQMYILDRCLQPVPLGVVGELFIGGDGVARGYLNRVELTAQRFIDNPFSDKPNARMYRTGDLARYLSDGSIEFLGRNDFQVKIRGYRIELGEIEKLLDKHPAINKSVVIAREDVPGDKRLVAYFIPYPNQNLTTSDLRDYLKDDLPEFMIPAHFVAMKEFPLTPNLKTDRKALPAPDQAALTSETIYVPPESDLEEKIASIWREVLNVSSVGMNDNFFDLGGHSLLTVEAHRRLKEVIESDLTVTDLFRFTTIRSLVDHLSQKENGDEDSRLQKSLSRAEKRKQRLGRR